MFLVVVTLSFMIAGACDKKDNGASEIKDGDGNVYQTVTIGTQVWLNENMKTTSYNDGTPLNLVESADDWNKDISGAYCWYNNNETEFKSVYGALYNWHAVNSDKLCPRGFRVADSLDWVALATFAGGTEVAGGMLKEMGEIHWDSPNTGATDTYGFSAVGGGFRNYSGSYLELKSQGNWWSSSAYSQFTATTVNMNFVSNEIFFSIVDKATGFSVRCIKE